MQRYSIPTARYRAFTELDAALAYVRNESLPIVIKADGLAAGKGVVIANTHAEACDTLHAMLGGTAFGAAGRRVVIEEFIQGEEASFIVMAEGTHVLPLATSQDHKRRDDGDQGPNTGGMGACSPAPIMTPALHARVLREVIDPTLHGMAAEGHPYRGFLYAGLMISPDGEIKVLEYNCRFGDPETQPILLRLKSDLVDLCRAACTGRLDAVEAVWDARAAVGVVLAAGGYPAAVRQGEVITGLPEDAADAKVFHAATALRDGDVVTAGGRVLCATALGVDAGAARARAYAYLRPIHWEGMFHRRDIGRRAMDRSGINQHPSKVPIFRSAPE